MAITQFPPKTAWDFSNYKTPIIASGTTAVLANGVLNTILSVTNSGFIKRLKVALSGTAPSGSSTTRGFAVKITIDDIVVYYKKNEITSNGTHPGGLIFITTDGVFFKDSTLHAKTFYGGSEEVSGSNLNYPSSDGGTIGSGGGSTEAVIEIPVNFLKYDKNFKIETQYYPYTTETYAVSYDYTYYTI